MSDQRPKLQLDDDFVFACHKGLKCYTSCCRDVNIMLTPHDVLRMKKALGLTSSEFLEKYTDLVQLKGKAVPLVQFRMNEADNKKCFFVGPGGCAIYEHRPWACRMFPLDEHAEGGFQVAVTPDRCHGLAEGDDWQVRNWLKDQGATSSKEMDGSYESLVSHEWINKLGELDNPKVQQMILLALYDLDRFREFILNSSFLDRFDLDEDTIFAAKTDDVALLDLGYAWVRFGLFGQKTLKLKEQPAEDSK